MGDFKIIIKSKSMSESLKVNVFCAVSQTKVYDPLFFHKNTVMGVSYYEML